MSFSSWIQLILGVLIFVLVLIPAILFTRAVTRSDLNNLRIMVSELGPLGGIVVKILNLIEKLMSALKL